MHSFNSRARMGRDDGVFGFYRNGVSFQFTRPHGARPRKRCTWCLQTCFNSRARMGRDMVALALMLRDGRFNSRARMGRDVQASDQHTHTN